MVLGVENLMLLNPFELVELKEDDGLKLENNELEVVDTVPLLDTDEKLTGLLKLNEPEEPE